MCTFAFKDTCFQSQSCHFRNPLLQKINAKDNRLIWEKGMWIWIGRFPKLGGYYISEGWCTIEGCLLQFRSFPINCTTRCVFEPGNLNFFSRISLLTNEVQILDLCFKTLLGYQRRGYINISFFSNSFCCEINYKNSKHEGPMRPPDLALDVIKTIKTLISWSQNVEKAFNYIEKRLKSTKIGENQGKS